MNLAWPAYALVVLTVALGIVGEWGPEPFAGLWRIAAAVTVLLLAYEWAVARHRNFRIERHLPPRAYLGQPAAGTLMVLNDDAWHLELVAADEPPAGVEAGEAPHRWRLAPGGEASSGFTFTPVRLGEAAWDRISARVRGHLGLAWWNCRLEAPGRVTVVPDRLRDGAGVRSGTVRVGEHGARRAGSGYDLLGLREYRPGDPVRTIDWKATARSGRPTVRVMCEEQHLELVVLIDAGLASRAPAGALDRLGHFANIGARLTEKALAAGDRVHLVAFADTVLETARNLRGQAGLRQARGVFERLRPVLRNTSPLTAMMHVRRLGLPRSLVVVLTDLDDGDAASELVGATALLRPKHLPLVAGIMDDEVERIRTAPARHWLDPYAALAAGEVEAGWRRTRLRLQRLGALVELAPEAHLDARLLTAYDRLRQRRAV